jgi:hypothetical protein
MLHNRNELEDFIEDNKQVSEQESQLLKNIFHFCDLSTCILKYK